MSCEKTNQANQDSYESYSMKVADDHICVTNSDNDLAKVTNPVKHERQSRSWKTVWYDFSQNTTLHGVNKVIEETPFTCRR